MAIPVSAALAGVCGLLLVALAANVSRLRITQKIAFGDAGNPAVMRAVRVHANTAEHAPIFILLALAFELSIGTTPLLTAMAVTFVVARLVFTAGVLGRGLHLARMAGAALTYVTQAVLALALVFKAVA